MSEIRQIQVRITGGATPSRQSALARLGASLGPAMRAIGASVVPGGRWRLMAEAELEGTRLAARALGLDPEQADEAWAQVAAEVASRPEFVPLDEIGRRTRVRLTEQAFDITPLRNLGMTCAEAAEGWSLLTRAVAAPDQIAYDHRPDDCWRCDAKPADGALGLCTSCRTDLT